MPYRSEVDKNLCVSTASCVAIAASTFELGDEGIVQVKQQNGDSDEKILEAAKSCPVDAITVFDETGKKIWPEQ